MINAENDKLGAVAYEAYADSRRWLTFDGKEMPRWKDVRDDIKEAWIEAALAVKAEVE